MFMYRFKYDDVWIYTGGVMSLAIVVVRVPKELKEKMRKYKHVNWSEVIRKTIQSEVRRLELEEAVEIVREIYSKTVEGVYDSVETIRRDRDEN